MLLQLAQAVANATATLVLKGKNVASQCPDTAQQANVIGAAKDTAMTTSQLVACVKLVVPTISSQMCQDQVVEAAKQVAKAVGDTEDSCQVESCLVEISNNCTKHWIALSTGEISIKQINPYPADKSLSGQFYIYTNFMQN